MKRTFTVIGLLTLIYGLAAMLFFSSCASVRSQERNCKYYQNHYVGYNGGGYNFRTKSAKR